MQKRLMSLLISLVTMLTLLPQLAMPAQAAYENTYKNTGDQRADLIGVALTQVGYREGSGNNNKNKSNLPGKPGGPRARADVSAQFPRVGVSLGRVRG